MNELEFKMLIIGSLNNLLFFLVFVKLNRIEKKIEEKRGEG